MSIKIEDINKKINALQIETFGNKRYGTKKEIQYLPEVLKDKEEILALASGLMNGNTWLIVCTDSRVIFLDKGMFYGLKQTDIPLDKINSMSHKIGWCFGSIDIWTGGSKTQIKDILCDTVKPFIDVLNRAIDALKMPIIEIPPAHSNVSNLDQIEKLFSLKEKGILTEEEFLQHKAKLL